MTAALLDGKATAAKISTELIDRVTALRSHGIVLGLGTVLVGEDPGSASYVAGKHRDCAEVGIVSIRRVIVSDPQARTRHLTHHQLDRPLRGNHGTAR